MECTGASVDSVDNAGGRPGGALINIRLDTTAAARPRGARCHETHTPQVKLHDTVLHSTSKQAPQDRRVRMLPVAFYRPRESTSLRPQASSSRRSR